MGGGEPDCIQETLSRHLTSRLLVLLEHSGIRSAGASGGSSDGGQSGGCRHLGRGGRGRTYGHHCGQLPSEPSTADSFFVFVGPTSKVVFQKDGMLGQPQQRLGIRDGPDSWPAGLATEKNTPKATTSRRPPCHRGNTSSGTILNLTFWRENLSVSCILVAGIVTVRCRSDAHSVTAYVSQPGHQRELGP